MASCVLRRSTVRLVWYCGQQSCLPGHLAGGRHHWSRCGGIAALYAAHDVCVISLTPLRQLGEVNAGKIWRHLTKDVSMWTCSECERVSLEHPWIAVIWWDCRLLVSATNKVEWDWRLHSQNNGSASVNKASTSVSEEVTITPQAFNIDFKKTNRLC
jgi:hypothetical protein